MCLHNADSEWINYIKSGYKLEEDKEEEKPIFIFKGKEYLPQGNDPKSYKNEAIAYFCRNNKNENYMSILHRITKK